MKLKVFLWLITHDMLQTGVELKRKWRGSPPTLCSICSQPETVDRIFFNCVLARFTRLCFKEALGWNQAPTGWQDFLDNWFPFERRDYNAKLFLLAMVLWVLWITRNKRAIEGKFLRFPIELIFKCCVFVQKWKVLIRTGEQTKIEGVGRTGVVGPVVSGGVEEKTPDTASSDFLRC